MSQPPGFVDAMHPSHVCKLNKALYGLKQAPRAWFTKLKNFLLAHHFHASQADPSLFIYKDKDTTLYLLIYVDDILLTGNSPQAITSLVTTLNSHFSLKDIGAVNYFLGIQVNSTQTGLCLTQSNYMRTILQRANMTGAKPVSKPLQVGLQLSKSQGTPLEDPHTYRMIVGALQYATITHPDLSFSVNKVAQFMASPTDIH